MDLFLRASHFFRLLLKDKNNIFYEYFRERESHSAHLKSIEAELDAQMAKVEQQALAKAKQEYDSEKRSLQSKMDAELTELQTQLRLFQKVIYLSFVYKVFNSMEKFCFEWSAHPSTG